MRRPLILIAGSITLGACSIFGSNVELAEGTRADPIVVTRDCRGAPDSEIFLNAAAADGDQVIVNVEFGGGCSGHAFGACWDGSILESSPPRVHLTLHHQSPDPVCLAIVNTDLVIDASSLHFLFGSAATFDPNGIELVGR